MSQNTDENKNTHAQYTEAYVNLLSTYSEHFKQASQRKNELKDKFFDFIKCIMNWLVWIFAGVIVLTLVLLSIMAGKSTSSIEIVVGAIVSVISSFVTMVLAIFKLPKIIADYLFNKQEDEMMKSIIENIQNYEIQAVDLERVKEAARTDAKLNTIIAQTDEDSEMQDSSYIEIEPDDNLINSDQPQAHRGNCIDQSGHSPV